MRVLLSIAALLFLATFAPARLFREPEIPASSRLWFEPVPLDPAQPQRTRLGALRYLGGWSLSSNDPRFGGISSLHVEDGEVLALSDSGILFRFALPGAKQGLPIRVRRLLDGTGDPSIKMNRDSEAMTLHGDHLWVSYERNNVVWRYDRDTLKGEAGAAPAAMRGWYRNRGGEAIVRLPGGRFLIVSERGHRGARFSDGLLFDGDPALGSTRTHPFWVRRAKDYLITDAALLPDGRLLFLHRRFSYLQGISAKLTIADTPEFKDGATIDVREIAHFEPPLTVDNMEGLSVTREHGRTIVWIASDNNYMGIQRTLLLKFALDG